MKTIEFLPISDMRVLKVVQVIGQDWNSFTGYLPYLRIYNPEEYDHENGDLLDQEILNSIRHNYPKSFLRYNVDILFKDQLNDNLSFIDGGTKLKFKIQFTPQIPFDLAPKLAGHTFYAYPKDFEVRMQFGEHNEKQQLINTFYLCSVPYEKIDSLIKTIESV